MGSSRTQKCCQLTKSMNDTQLEVVNTGKHNVGILHYGYVLGR